MSFLGRRILNVPIWLILNVPNNVHKFFWVQHQVAKSGVVGLYGFPSSSSRVREMSTKDSELSSFSSRAQYPAFDSTSSHLEITATRLVRS